jgi:hypothetical protein
MIPVSKGILVYGIFVRLAHLVTTVDAICLVKAAYRPSQTAARRLQQHAPASAHPYTNSSRNGDGKSPSADNLAHAADQAGL